MVTKIVLNTHRNINIHGIHLNEDFEVKNNNNNLLRVLIILPRSVLPPSSPEETFPDCLPSLLGFKRKRFILDFILYFAKSL